jgi:para-nitrobenzyl esterase
LVLGATSAAFASPGTHHGPIVRTDSGTVRGLASNTVEKFLGLPYAKPPIDGLRWRPPVPASHWPGIRDATTDPPACPQDPGALVPGTSSATREDCLYLSIYRPARTSPRAKLPVLFWMHGGGYGSGAGWLYDGSALASKNAAIVVTINYRLGALGYLTLPSLDAEQGNSGNYGFLDQIAALRWVRDNIGAFGGDPARVAIDGQSAGAGSACAMLASPQAKGLFSTAIMQSAGNCLTGSKSGNQSGDAAFAQAAGCPAGSAATQLGCLRSKPVADILAASSNAPRAPWSPAVGGTALPIDPLSAVRSGTWNRVPVVTGTTRDEGRAGIQYVGASYPLSVTAYTNQIHAFFGTDADKVLAEYPASNYTDPSYAEAAVLTDSGFQGGLGGCFQLKVANTFAAATATYFYELYDPNAPPLTVAMPPAGFQMGSAHSADLAYVFQNGFRQQSAPFTPAQTALSDSIMRYWSSFAATGNPNTAGQPSWPAYQASGAGIVQLSPNNISVMPDYQAEHHCTFWQSLGRV